MAKTVDRLSDRSIKAIKSAGMYADGRGLYLQATGEGDSIAKSWILRYSLQGKAREMGLGSFRDVTLAEAREERDSCRKLLKDHIDPIAHRAQRRNANSAAVAKNITFKEAAEKCLPIATKKLTNAKHAAQWTSTIVQYAYPVLGKMYVRDITVNDVYKVLEPMWEDMSETGSRVRARIQRILDWARINEFSDPNAPNPARFKGNLDLLLGDKKKAEPRASLPYADLPAFMAQLRQQTGVAARALEFVILTAARTQEARLAELKEIDEAEKLWTAPADHMKLKREHLVPLCDRSIELIQESRGTQFLFPSSNGQALSENALGALMERMNKQREAAGLSRWIDPKLNRDAVPHGFRSTFKVWAEEKSGFDNYVSKAALAHAIGDKTEAAYNRSTYLAKRRTLMEAWAAYCAGIKAPADNVIPMRA